LIPKGKILTKKIWTLTEIEEHLKANLGEGDDYSYGGAIVCAAFFKKFYNVYPKIGLSGFQAEAVQSIVDCLPDANIPLEPERLGRQVGG